MALSSRRATIVAAAFLVVAVAAAAGTSLALRKPIDPVRIVNNDMVDAAGRTSAGVYRVVLEARKGDWRPDGPDGVVLRVAAFAQQGGAMQVPGPLIRTTSGTEVRATVHNSLDVPLMMYGLGVERGLATDSVLIAPGAAHEFVFMAGEPGVYYYAGRTTPVPTLLERTEFDSQLNGALVVDAAGTRGRPRDRLLMLTQWFTADSTTVSGLGPDPILAINGRMWPHTETIEAVQGDTLHWRLINATIIPHPMHLHGFYFRVDARGDDAAYNVLPEAERFMAVTELMMPGTTLALTWTPERPGNWVFHCHFAGHMATEQALNQDRRHPVTIAAALDPHDHGATSGPAAAPGSDAGAAHDLGAHAQHNMSGLVLGIRVKPRGRQAAEAGAARPIRLLMRSQPAVYGGYTGYAFALDDGVADGTALTIPGPTLVLRRNEPVAITLVNHSHEPAAVHWHGVELESFPDGVPGWSGSGRNVLPLIAPRDSLTVRFTPPRAGTFMYHSHFNEFQQISSGMYGAIVVLDDGVAFDADTDRILLFSDGGPAVNLFAGPFPPVLLNGAEHPGAMQLRSGAAYRFRLINILSEGIVGVTLLDGAAAGEWRLLARDGADLPPSQAKMVPAELIFASGTIHDVQFTPARTGAYTLKFGPPGAPGVAVQVVVD